MSRAKTSLVVAFFTLSLAACESTEKDKIASAQECLNSATPGTVGQCRAFLDGLTTPESYLIRCAIDFVAQGFTAKAMATAFDQLNKSGSSQTATMMSYLVFSTQNAADETYKNCRESGEPSYVTIASFVQVATLAAATAGLLTGSPLDRNNPVDMTTAISTLISTPTTHATVGSAIQNAYNAQCSAPANQSSPSCEKIVKAIQGGGSSADVGLRFLNSLQ